MEHPNYIKELEENQVIDIYKAMIWLAEEFVGQIDTASLKKYEPGKSYTGDEIRISGVIENGRKYRLELTLENPEDGANDRN